jgi:hypothetical protein
VTGTGQQIAMIANDKHEIVGRISTATFAIVTLEPHLRSSISSQKGIPRMIRKTPLTLNFSAFQNQNHLLKFETATISSTRCTFAGDVK